MTEIELLVNQLARTMRILFNGKPVQAEKTQEQAEARQKTGVPVLQESKHRAL